MWRMYEQRSKASSSDTAVVSKYEALARSAYTIIAHAMYN